MVSLFHRITKDGKAMFLAYDQGLEHGPKDFNEHNADPHYIFQLAHLGKFTAVITQKGVAQKYYSDYKHRVPLIIKLNGKTSLTKSEPYSPLLCTVQEAVELGAVGVGYTVYVGSPREDEMLSMCAAIVHDAHKLHIPVIGWMYPRGEGIVDDDPNIVAYAARVSLELGCDMVKIKYPGSVEALRWAVHCAGKTKVVVSGGSRVDPKQFSEDIKDWMKAGVAGVAVGRNIWQQEDPLEVADHLRKVIF